MTELHGILVVVLGAIDTTHHTLIVTKEEDRQSGDAVDGDEKAALLKLVDNIVLTDEIHRDGRSGKSIDGAYSGDMQDM